MKVHEMIHILRGLDPDTEVVLSSDGEGNEYSSAAEISEAYAEPGWIGGRLEDILDEEDYDDEDEDLAGFTKIIVIWPV